MRSLQIIIYSIHTQLIVSRFRKYGACNIHVNFSDIRKILTTGKISDTTTEYTTLTSTQFHSN